MDHGVRTGMTRRRLPVVRLAPMGLALLLLVPVTAPTVHPAETDGPAVPAAPLAATAPYPSSGPKLLPSTPPSWGWGDWTTYGHDNDRSGSNFEERTLSVANASSLQLAWSAPVGG